MASEFYAQADDIAPGVHVVLTADALDQMRSFFGDGITSDASDFTVLQNLRLSARLLGIRLEPVLHRPEISADRQLEPGILLRSV